MRRVLEVIRSCGGFGVVCPREAIAVVLLLAGLVWVLAQLEAITSSLAPVDVNLGPGPTCELNVGESGRHLWLVRSENGLYRRSLADGCEEPVLPPRYPVSHAAIFDGEQDTIWAIARHDHIFEIWWNGRIVVEDRTNPPEFLRSIALADRGRLLVAATEYGLVRSWKRTEATFVLAGEYRVADNVECIAVSPDGRFVACASTPPQLTIWDIEQNRRHATWTLPTRTANLAWSPDGALLAAVGGFPGQLSVWEAKTGRQMWCMNADVADPMIVRFSPDGNRLYTGGFDRRIREWDTATGVLRSEFEHNNAVKALALSPNGDRLYAGDLNGNVLSWPL